MAKDDWYEDEIDQSKFKESASKIGTYHTGKRQSRKMYIKPEVPLWGPKVGDRTIRVIRPLEYAELKDNKELGLPWGMHLRFHRGIGPNKDFFVCPNYMFGKPCPVCAVATDTLWKTNKAMAKYYGVPDHRVLTWIIDLELEENDEKYGMPQIYPMPKGLSEEILARSSDRETGVFIDVGSPASGVMVYFTRTGEGLATKYGNVQIGTKPVPIPPEVKDLMMPFSEVLVLATVDEMKEALIDFDSSIPMESGEDGDSAADEKPPSCFGVGYDRYADCGTTCKFTDDCKDNMGTEGVKMPVVKSREDVPESKPKLPEKPAAPKSEEKPAAPKGEEKPAAPKSEEKPAKPTPEDEEATDVEQALYAKIRERQKTRVKRDG